MKKKANTDSQPINGGLAGEVVSEDYEGWLEQAEIEASRPLTDPCFVGWMQRDTWSTKDAMLLLLGIDPDKTSIHEQQTEYGRPSFCFDADGPYIIGIDEQATRTEIRRLEEQLTSLMRTWDSGQNQPVQSPAYFLRWAFEHGSLPKWYEVACEMKLIDPVHAVVDSETAKVYASGTAHDGYTQPKEEPPMRVGRNKRADCTKWFAYMAHKVDGATRDERAEKIKTEADRRHYLPEKADEISIGMIVSAIPKGTTGSRQDNRNGGKRSSKRQ